MKLILLGAPGAGKGSISDLLVKNTDLMHISTGNLFRDEIAKETPLAWELRNILNSGGLVSDDITNQVAKNAIKDVVKNNKGFILDGYPRTLEQAKFLDTVVDIDYVFYLDVSKEILLKRISGRRLCPNCKAIYNVLIAEYQPKVQNECDLCHSVLMHRKDDDLETALKRIVKYNEETFPLIKYYEQKNKLVKFDGEKNIQEIYQEIVEYENNHH